MVVAIFDCGQSLRLRRIGVHCVLVYWDELDKRPGAGSGGRTFSTLFDYLLFTSHTTILGTIHDLQVIFSTSQHHQQVVHRWFFQFFDVVVVVVGDLFFFFECRPHKNVRWKCSIVGIVVIGVFATQGHLHWLHVCNI